jgi:hypothetical protein
MQELGMQGAYDAAAAFGLAPRGGDALAGIPEAKDFGGGMMGYSSGDLFDLARAEFEGRNPQQAALYNQFYAPYGGGQPGAGFPADGSVPPPKELTSGTPEGAGGSYGPYGLPNNFPTNPVDIAAWLQSQGIDPSTFPR